MKRSKRIGALAAGFLAAATLVTSCSSGGSGGGSDLNATDLDGEPIVIGYMIPDSGPEANPQVGPMLNSTIKYINNEMGGVNGRPLQVKECHTDQSPAKDTACANDFVGDGVVAVIDGFNRGIEYSLPVYQSAKIPVFGNVAQNAVADTDTSGTFFSLGPANAVYAIGPLVAFKDRGMTTITYGVNDIPAQHTYVDKFLTPVAKELGMKLDVVWYDDASPNFSVVAATAASNKADVLAVVKLANPTQCKQFIDQSRQAGYNNALLAGNCVGLEQLGTDSKNIYTYSNNYFPAMKDHAPESAQADLEVMEKIASDIPEEQRGYFTYETMATLMDFVNIVKPLKTVDPASITDAAKSLKGFQGFAGDKLTCDGTAFPGTSACTNTLLLSESLGDGTLKPTGPEATGGFVAVDPALVPK